MKIIVTGGAGFIGSALVRKLISETSNEVLNIDKLTYAGNLKSLELISDSELYSFEKVDICNRDKISEIFKQFLPHTIIHLAAESHVDNSIKGPSDFINTNVIGTLNLLEEFRLNAENSKEDQFQKFIHVSTDEVYGDLPHPDESDLHPLPKFREESPYKPSSPYSASKAGSDHLAAAWHRTYKLPIIITNCSNNYGPYQFPEKLIPLVIFNALNGKPIPVYGKGDQIRDWLYVDDHVDALIKISKEGKIGEKYNIGGQNELRNIEVIEKICNILDKKNPPDKEKLHIDSYLDLIVFVEDRLGHDKRYSIDIDKINKELKWEPSNNFEQGIESTVDWYIENRSWFDR
tara:strand:+ start:915 stop:1955 length:1041 start_codon:yes stop_codon:yes gene_type:complete